MSTLENPFHPPLKGSGETDTEKDVKLVQKLLGDEDAALLASVRGKQGKRTETMLGDIMTDEEREMLTQAQTKECEQTWDRDGYIKWAKSIGKDEKWVDDTFRFNEDGTVLATGDINLVDVGSLPSFPSNITGVGGSIQSFETTSVENFTFPKSVLGWLVFPRLNTAKRLIFPEGIGGGVGLNSLTTALDVTWPYYIGGDLFVPRALSTEAEDLKKTGVLKGRIVYTN